MLKVGVLFGGKSIEREVSFNSGRTICDHLDTQYFEVIPIFQRATGDLYILPWSFLYRGKIADFEHRLEAEAQKIKWDDLPHLIDFMYIATHGQYAEDGRLQAILELLKIPYLGAKMFGASVAMNKQLHNDFLHAHGITTPNGFCISVEQIKQHLVIPDLNHVSSHKKLPKFIKQQLLEKRLHFPLVVKPLHEGSSFGVSVVHTEGKLQQAIHDACFVSSDTGQGVIVEEKIDGMEFTCIIITDPITGELIPLPPTEIVIHKDKEIFDYEQKYMPGAVNEITPASGSKKLLKKMQDTCVQAMKALEFTNMARIDGFVTKDEQIVIIDSNPLSGMGPATFLFRQAAEAGMGHAELINTLIKAELKNYKMEKQMKTTKTTNKKPVAVLLGGPSQEREISLESGRNVCYKLSPEKYHVIPVFVDQDMKLHVLDNKLLVHTSTREITANLSKAKAINWSDLKDLVDFVFIALHGGPGENGIVQGTLEMLGIPYNGSSIFTSSLCMDKYKTGKFLKAKGFETPCAYLMKKQEWQEKQLDGFEKYVKQLQYPCIVKPHDDGCSVMVAVAHNKKELYEAIDTVLKQKEHALVEQKIIGMELTVGVVGNDKPRALAPSEAVVSHEILSIEEKFLPGAGENQTPARLRKEDIAFVQEHVVAAYKAVNARGYARIDCFFQNEQQSPTGSKRVVILEFNTLPGLTPATCLFHQAAEEGLRPMDLLDEIIQLGMQCHQYDNIVLTDKNLYQQQ